jgi:hypothetical protein
MGLTFDLTSLASFDLRPVARRRTVHGERERGTGNGERCTAKGESLASGPSEAVFAGADE